MESILRVSALLVMKINLNAGMINVFLFNTNVMVLKTVRTTLMRISISVVRNTMSFILVVIVIKKNGIVWMDHVLIDRNYVMVP